MIKHGMYRTKIYAIWCEMKRRCDNKSHKYYQYYGGRGISVCKRWSDSFERFYEDMGDAPLGMTLERRNNNGNYEPDNCKWAGRVEQSNNMRSNVFLEFKGLRLTVTEWSRRLNIKRSTIYARIFRGWSIEKILGKPVQSWGR
tara:strand:- start:1241 stop:1669 length:429 start_codon:yes stop_codon:yes gene_type:complete